jgi:hypothetical protein
MGTICYREIVDTCIARNGEHYSDDGDGTANFDVVKIVQYTTPEGDPNNYGFVYRHEIAKGMGDRYEHSVNCLFPKVVWTRTEPSDASS